MRELPSAIHCRIDSEDQDVDESHYPLWVDENSDEGDGPMSAETISFKIEVECARRRDRGKKSLEFRHSRDKTQGRRCQCVD
jgi:hypothetical protein